MRIPVIIATITFFAVLANAQTNRFNVIGRVFFEDQPLSGAKIEIYIGDLLLETTSTKSGGEFVFDLESDRSYIIKFTKNGYFGKRIDFNTVVPEGSSIRFKTEFEVSLYKACDGVDIDVLDEPIDVIRYSPSQKQFISDEAHYQKMRARLDRLQGNIDMCFNNKYNGLIEESKALMNQKQWEDAKGKAREAIALFPSERPARRQLDDVIKAEQDEKDRISLFNKFIYAGDKALDQMELDLAVDSYDKAKKLDPENPILPEKYAAVEAARKRLAEEEEKERQYQELLSQASVAEQQKDYRAATKYINRAKEIKPEDTYAEKKITVLTPLVNQQEEEEIRHQQQEKAYREKLARGEEALRNNELEKAQQIFKEASETAPASKAEAINKLAGVNRKIAEKKQAELDAVRAEMERQFQVKIDEGNNHLDRKEFDDAIASFNEAQHILPQNPEPQQLINKTKNLVVQEEEKKAARVNVAYNNTLAMADSAKLAKDYQTAKQLYNKAIALKPGDNKARSRINEVAKLEEDERKAQEELIERKNNYLNLISEADAQFKAKQYTNAINTYNKALDILPNELYPKNKIVEAKNIMAQLEIEAKFNGLISEADALIENQEFERALAILNRATTVKPESTIPGEKANYIKQLQNDIAKQDLEARFIELIATADEQKRNKQYDAAIATLNSAKGVKPESTLPDHKINDIKALLNQMEAAEINQEFTSLLAQADELVVNKDYEKAITILQQAKALKPQSAVPENKINDIKAIQNRLTREEVQKQFDAIVARADDKYANKDYNDAIAAYNRALALIPDANYPKQKINEINQIKSDELLAQIREKYNSKLQEAANAFNAGNLDLARELYKSALGILPDEQYPQDQINKINAQINRQQQEQEQLAMQEQKYQKAIALADKYYKEKNYPLARAEYNRALSYKPNEAYPNQQISKISTEEANYRQKQQELAALEQAYLKAVNDGDLALRNNEYDKARALYEQALGLKANEVHPKEQIKRIEQILAEVKAKENSQQAKEEKFKKLLTDADELYKAYKYQNARLLYSDALKVKPTDQYAQSMIRKIDDLLKLTAGNNVQKPVSTDKKEKYVLNTLKFKSEGERTKYFDKLKDEYPPGVTKEIYREKYHTVNRYIVIRDNEVSEFRHIRYNYGDSQYTFNGNPITGQYFKTQVGVRENENFTEKEIDNK